MSKEESKIEKAWRKEQQKEMMWWIGIHIFRTQRAELSWDLSKYA